MNIPEFSSLVKNNALDGNKIKIDEVLDKPVIVTGFKISKSKYKGDCAKVQFHFENSNENLVFFTGSKVIIDQLEQVEKALIEQGAEFSFKTTVRLIGKYYSLT